MTRPKLVEKYIEQWTIHEWDLYKAICDYIVSLENTIEEKDELLRVVYTEKDKRDVTISLLRQTLSDQSTKILGLSSFLDTANDKVTELTRKVSSVDIYLKIINSLEKQLNEMTLERNSWRIMCNNTADKYNRMLSSMEHIEKIASEYCK